MSTRPHDGVLHETLTDQHKEAVKAWVPKVRSVLEEEFAAQLDRLGLRPNGRHTPVQNMQFAEKTARTRERVEALLARDRIAEGTAERGFDNVRRELAYTLLNRLVGLKAMEARALLYLCPPSAPSAPPSRPSCSRWCPARNTRGTCATSVPPVETATSTMTTRSRHCFGTRSLRLSATSRARLASFSIRTTTTPAYGRPTLRLRASSG